MTNRTRDPAEYIQLLRDQLGFLDDSARNFDQGQHSEYARLAVSIRVLLHDTKTSTSLLTHLGIKQSLKYLNTAGSIVPFNLLTEQKLVMEQFGGGSAATYVAPLDMERPPSRRPAPARLGFGQWWQQPVVKDKPGSVFTRGTLVQTVANKEGGAHVDRDLPEEWWALTRENSSAWREVGSGRPLGSPVPASVRQIAYELRETIVTQVPGVST